MSTLGVDNDPIRMDEKKRLDYIAGKKGCDPSLKPEMTSQTNA